MRPPRIAGAAAATAIVGAGTALNRLAGVPLSSWAATPRAVGDGKVWLLLTSGLLADNPWLPSLMGFLIVLVVALHVLSVPHVVGAAAFGQIASAALVYGIVGAAHSVDPHLAGSLLGHEDYGLSAMIAAWIGAIAWVGWTRYSTPRGRLAVVAGCVVCLFVGLAFRPHLDFLDSEHLVAFGMGALVARSIPGRIAVPTRKIAAAFVAGFRWRSALEHPYGDLRSVQARTNFAVSQQTSSGSRLLRHPAETTASSQGRLRRKISRARGT